MTVSPPGHWLLNRIVFLLNRTLGIINTAVENGLVFLLQNSNTFTGVNTFMGGIKVNNIDSINGNTNITFQNNINMNSNDISNINILTANELNIDLIKTNTAANISVISDIDITGNLTVLGTIRGETGTIRGETGTICKIITHSPSSGNPSCNYTFGANQPTNSINFKFENYKKTKHTNNIVEIKSSYTIKPRDELLGVANGSDKYYGNLTFIDNNSTKIFRSGDFSLIFFGWFGGGGHRSSSLNDIYLYVDDEFESNNITIELNLWTTVTDDIFSISNILFIVTEIWK